jgi:hypothetical protein
MLSALPRLTSRTRRPSKPLLSPGDPTIYGTPVCPPGSTAASTRPRSPSGPATASTCCCGSTQNASWARTSSPSAASAMRYGRTAMTSHRKSDLGLWHVFGTASRIWRPWTALSRTSSSQARSRITRVRPGQTALSSTFEQWGGWGSNPRPADYESANPRPRSSPVILPGPVMPAQAVNAGLTGGDRGRAVHRTSVPIVFPSGGAS